MKKTIYIQPQTNVECAIPQIALLVGSYETGGLPSTEDEKPSGPGLPSPARKLYI